jgi:hypothetical protein
MKEVNYRKLQAGDAITVVTAWMETEMLDDIANAHFFETRIARVYFEPKGELAFLRIWVTDGDGLSRRVNYLIQDGHIVSASVVVKLADLTSRAGMICLSDRKGEFMAALQRGEKSDLDVHPDFETDAFVVVNRVNGKEYRVRLAAGGGEVFAACACDDFVYRRRVCKHISEVLADTFCGVRPKATVHSIAERRRADAEMRAYREPYEALRRWRHKL